VQNDLVAFKMYYRLSPAQQRALHGWVELFLFPGGYGGLQLSEDKMANLCLLVNRRTLRARGKNWAALIEHLCDSSPALAVRLDGAQPLLAKPLALSSIPYGMQLAHSQPGLWRLGDQAAVIPSFSGDGMAIALHSAQRAAACFLAGKSSETYAATLARELHGSIGFATTVARLLIAAPALAQAARLWPPLLKLVADRTRIFPYALAAE
jgi:flavin-dependent dehydrogenase